MRLITPLLASVFLLICPVTTFGQPGGGGPPPPVPISGIEILIGAGALFGAKKIYDSRKKR
jgi:hypothetical protein